MAFEKSELIHDQSSYPAAIWLNHLTLQALIINSLYRVPVQPQELRHMLQREKTTETRPSSPSQLSVSGNRTTSERESV
jgi:hypothetical protein